jgi:hypothetical protein
MDDLQKDSAGQVDEAAGRVASLGGLVVVRLARILSGTGLQLLPGKVRPREGRAWLVRLSLAPAASQP